MDIYIEDFINELNKIKEKYGDGVRIKIFRSNGDYNENDDSHDDSNPKMIITPKHSSFPDLII